MTTTKLCPHTVLWALGNPEGWRASATSDQGPACIEATRILALKGFQRSMTAWVALEYGSLDTVHRMMNEAVNNVDGWLAHAIAGESGLARATRLDCGRYKFEDAHMANREMYALRLQCRFATTEEVAA